MNDLSSSTHSYSLKERAKQGLSPRLREWSRDLYGLVRPDYYPYRSWSQTGEDMILRDLSSTKSDGFYVDIGAFHPRFGSNTYALHKSGWRGVNVDARPGSMAAFRRARSRDVNVELAIGTVPGSATFHIFVNAELSTLDEQWALENIARGEKLREKVTVEVVTLADLHRRYQVPSDYDVLTVDCEGRDVDVLRSNDWKAFRPRIVVVECSQGRLIDALESPAAVELGQHGYEPTAATRLSLVMTSID